MGPEEGQPLLRRVVLLQACIRGYLVRKSFQSITEDYEEIVKEIEGDSDGLRWNRYSLPQPLFLPKFAQKPVKRKELNGQGAGSGRSRSRGNEQTLRQEMLTPEREGDNKVQLPSRLSADVVAGVGAGDAGQNLEQLRDKLSGVACEVPGEDEEAKALSSVSSEWSSSILEMESPTLIQELPFSKVQEIPQTMPDLQRYRKNLAMELLWLQQAIVSRKNYLILKQRLGSPP